MTQNTINFRHKVWLNTPLISVKSVPQYTINFRHKVWLNTPLICLTRSDNTLQIFKNKKWLSILTDWLTEGVYSKPLKPSLHVSNVTDVRTYHSEFIWVGRRCISALLRFEIKDGLSQDLRLFTREETFSCHLTLHCSQLPRYGLHEERPHLQNVALRNIKGWIPPAS